MPGSEGRARGILQRIRQTAPVSAHRRDLLLTTTRKPAAARNDSGVQVMRVAVGRGSVTSSTIHTPVQPALAGDHGWLFVAATELRPADEVHFLTENDHPSLLTLMWRYGAPAIVLALVAIGFAPWRTSTRFGPLAEPQSTARRSLAEQIRGTGSSPCVTAMASRCTKRRCALSEAATRHTRLRRMSPGDRAGARRLPPASIEMRSMRRCITPDCAAPASCAARWRFSKPPAVRFFAGPDLITRTRPPTHGTA